jgi:AraC-like DNA-binding protein
MSDLLGNYAVPLDASVDALSDVLDLIHLRGEELAVVKNVDGTEVRRRAGDRMLYIVDQGPVELTVVGDGHFQLENGDLALLASGAAHRLRSSASGVWMSGRFLVEENTAAPLLAVLPPAIVIRSSEARFDRLPLGAGLLAAEYADPTAGSRVMVSRLLDLMFILALRAWSDLDGALHPGWLTAALDRSLGPALTAIHRHPEQPWTVEQLADIASMSRAAFAARFVRLVGEPPGRYLARIRLARAADQLSTTSDAVGSIGKAVGYTTEAAFSRAFAREYGTAPRAWRTTQRDHPR